MNTILIVEDDVKIADLLCHYLQANQFTVHLEANGLTALDYITRSPPALVLLDVMLPGLDGVSVCRAVRNISAIPIIMVTARVDELDRLLGLDTGADDYICKPFSPREVLARVKALLRRSQGQLLNVTTQPTVAHNYVINGLSHNSAAMTFSWHGQVIPFTPVEYRLTHTLLGRPGQVFSRTRLLELLHQDFRDVSDRAIDSHIKNIRRKFELAQVTGLTITSIYGVGYRLDKD